jgi:hypothetical protein
MINNKKIIRFYLCSYYENLNEACSSPMVVHLADLRLLLMLVYAVVLAQEEKHLELQEKKERKIIICNILASENWPYIHLSNFKYRDH